MAKIKMWMLASLIEWNWKRIRRNRSRMEALFEAGARYTSPALARLAGRTAEIGYRTRLLERTYRILAGLD